MRRVAVPLALAALLLTPTSVGAEEPALSDPTGDVEFTTSAPGAPPLPASSVESTQASDLVALHATETDDTLVFAITVASLAGTSAFTNPRLSFGWDGGDFELQFLYFRDGVGGGRERAWASLVKVSREDREFVAEFALAVDAGAGTLTAAVPKVYLVAEDGRVPGRGDVIVLRSVEANANVFGGGGLFAARAHDRMPDAEGDPVLLTLERGDFTQGSVVLSSPDRVRVSNGGATTFVFQARVRNTAEVEDEFALGLEDVPEGWNASVQTPLKLPAKEERTVSVLVSVPFAHEHGGYSSFNLTVQSARDAATQAKMRMGVLHTPIPQPAGHHSDLYLHAEERDFGGPASQALLAALPSASGWMNTQAEHAEDASYVTPGSVDEGIGWRIRLNPALQLGLDFDLERIGELKASIVGKRSGDAQVRVALLYESGEGDEGETIVLAEAAPTAIALDLQEPTSFAVTLAPTPESDYIAYQQGARMVLEIALDIEGTPPVRSPTTDPQLMVEDFVLSLPLNEYHDKLTGLAEAAESLEILAQGPVERVGLPGSVLTYPFTVRNGGPADVFVIDIAGNNAVEGIVVPEGLVSLGTGETREVTLAVEIPVGTNAGEELEVLLFVHGRDDPSKMAIARTKTLVTHDAGAAEGDEAHLLLDAQARENEAPGVGLAALVALAGLVAIARRRR